MKPLKVLHVAAEFAPFVHVGGLADVTAALLAGLAADGHDARALVPAYSDLNHFGATLEPVAGLESFDVTVAHRSYRCTLSTLPTQSGRGILYLLGCDDVYGRPGIYTQDHNEPLRFALLSQAALTVCIRLGWPPDIFHCHDWHASLLPLQQLDSTPVMQHPACVLTLHNLAHQGNFDSRWAQRLELDVDMIAPNGAPQCSFLRTGVARADLLTTVSPTYSVEIQHGTQGMGLGPLLMHRSDRLRGILNGIDIEEWNPETDQWIASSYTSDDLSGKLDCRQALLQRFELELPEQTPLLGVVSRLVHQKGLDLLLEQIRLFLPMPDLGLVVLGDGQPDLIRGFRELAAEYPKQVAFVNAFDKELAHQIEAGADVFVMPSRYEPCGLNQMYSQRYGTVPLVRRTGGLADTVEPYDPISHKGTGFSFEESTAEALGDAMQLCLDTFSSRRKWRNLMRNGMAQDFSWRRRIPSYVDAYREAMELKAGVASSLEAS